MPILILGLWVCEGARPLRRPMESRGRRLLRNLGVGAVSALALGLLERPLLRHLSARVLGKRRGLLQRRRLPPWLETAGGLLLMDYTLFLWHGLLHEVPFLYRFHRAHHADLELDASTGLRFHVGELLLSIPFRAAQVWLLGIGPQTLALWQRCLFLSILFHHANLRLPFPLERTLSLLVTTPRMHGIHHAVDAAGRSSNWSSGLSLWDRLHKRFRGPGEAIEQDHAIGVPGVVRAGEVTLGHVLLMPFGGRR